MSVQSRLVHQYFFPAAILLIAVLLCGGIAFAADEASSAEKAKIVEIVSALDTQYQEAVRNNDAATMGRILDDDFTLVLGKGQVFHKKDLIQEARDGTLHYEKQDEVPGTRTVRVYGDHTATVTALLWIKEPKIGDYKLWFTDVYVKRPAGWSYVLGQAAQHL
jgi:ketosteroid isomerase-like protein